MSAGKNCSGRGTVWILEENIFYFIFYVSFICIYFIFKFFIVVQVQLSPFSPHTSHHPTHPTSHPQSYPPLALSMGPLFMFLDDIDHSFSCYPPPPSALVTVRLFFISMPLVLFCLLACFVDQVPLIGKIIWYVCFTVWLISLSIMLSRSIHVVMKGRSSFLFAVYYSIV